MGVSFKYVSPKKLSQNMDKKLNLVDGVKNNELNQNIIKEKYLTNDKPKENTYKCVNLKSSVKSKYIIQNIFLHLNDKKKYL